jgi:hypothetical protein
MRFEALALVVGGLFAGACAAVAGLDNKYSLEPTSSDGGAMDGGADAKPPPSCSGDPGACADEVPPNWKRVGYAPSREIPCPSGFLQTDVQADPTVGADTCACGSCQITTPPSCAGGPIATFYDNGSGMCEETGLVLQGPPPDCIEFQGGTTAELTTYFKGTPAPPSGGACSLTAAPDNAKVAWTEGRLCLPETESCELDLCAGQGAFAECIMTFDQSDCPEAFPQKHAVGDASDIECGACDCIVQGSCTGTIEFYTNGQCTQGLNVVPANHTCVPVNGGPKYFTYKYFGKVDTMKCSDEPPTPGVFTPKTVLCCK